MKKNAFTEILDTTNPEEDENSTNNIYSFKYYFEQHFGVEEYKCFEKYITQFIEDVEEYVGVAVVRTLKPNALFGFRNKLLETIRGLDYSEIISELQGKELTHNQRQSINKQFFGMKYYMAMVGKRDFAKSFITAEGYTFKYWKGSEYSPADKYVVNEDHTFVAQWEKKTDPNGSDDPNKPGKGAGTGDNSHILLSLILMTLSMLALVSTLLYRRRRG